MHICLLPGTLDRCTVKLRGEDGRKLKLYIHELAFQECQVFVKIYDGDMYLNNARVSSLLSHLWISKACAHADRVCVVLRIDVRHELMLAVWKQCRNLQSPKRMR